MVLQRLKGFLDNQKIKYTVITHSPAYTTLEIAALASIPGKELAKTVIVNVDGKMTMAVLPASHMINLHLLRSLLNANSIELAGEYEFKDRFPECELGAMPPFGLFYNMDVIVADSLAEDEMIAFNAGT
ncbi:MAG: YbaK/EbsC family protein, partial [Bacteroidota bacterium]|nr:YbaK/EbsC family protein [Bacteroidota bacterium]